MKILIISDSHGNWKKIEQVERKEHPDRVFFLGDGADDTHILKTKCVGVLGNCDFSSKLFNDQEVVEVSGKKILLAHGHFYDVKKCVGEIVAFAKRNEIDIVCHGHSHIQNLATVNGVTVFNPGSLWENEYGVLEIKHGEFNFILKRV
ncbi:MAG: YfcE family phosphodiesterase [Fusobacteria bacterium]|nr:YfcE family phosphodiesterase [Fusobacteriota bacterium]